MKSKKILYLIFAGCLWLSAAACSGGGNNPGKTDYILPDYDLKKEELSIDIAGWVMPADFNETQFHYLAESGINVLQLASAGSNTYNLGLSGELNEKNKEFLKTCEDNGYKVYPHIDGKIAKNILQAEKLNDYKAAYGVIFDEPNKIQIDEIADYVSQFNQKADGKELFVNLYPSFATTIKTDFGGDYYSYLEYYCNKVLENVTSGQKWLSADRYPLTYDGKSQPCLDTGWLADVEAVAVTARKYENVKTNFFIQTMPYGGENNSGNVINSRDRVPTYEDVRLQEYVLISFGYDMISCFCYATPAVGIEFLDRQTAMIDRDGNKTEVYSAVAKANNEILAFDHVMEQFSWQGVFTCDAGKTATGKDRTSNASFSGLVNRMYVSAIDNLESVTASCDTLFGYFIDKEENAGFTIVNYNDSSLGLSDKVSVKFNSSYHYTKAQCYIGGEKQTIDLKDNVLGLTLGVGEGVFVIPY